jgi:hypothetical protein
MSAPSSRCSGRRSSCIGAGTLLALGLLTLPLAIPTRAENLAAPATSPAPVVTISPTPADSASVRYDFGNVGMAAGNTLQRAYTIKNGGSAPVIIQGITTSCGCTRASLDDHGLSGRGPTVTGGPVTLAPGQSAQLSITVNVSELHPGPIRKTITVSGASDASPLATIDLFATLVPAIAFSPQTIDFGPAEAGVAHTATLTATVDPKLLSRGKVPDLRSSDPSVRITLLPVSPVQRPGSSVPLTYQLTLAPDAPLGPVSGRLYFAPPPRASADDGQSLWDVGAGVTGQVVGDISAPLTPLSLGIIPAATGAKATIKVTGKDAAALTGLTCESADPSITARLLPDAPTAQEATLEVTVAPHHAPGVLQTQVTVHTQSGERLVLTIVGSVV